MLHVEYLNKILIKLYVILEGFERRFGFMVGWEASSLIALTVIQYIILQTVIYSYLL